MGSESSSKYLSRKFHAKSSRPAPRVQLDFSQISTGSASSAKIPAVNSSFDIIIVGAGIVGAACAAECAAGGLKVLVIDAGCIGGGVTACGMGHLVVMDDSPAQLAMTRYSRDLWRQFAAESPGLPADVEFDPCGTLWVAADEEEIAEVHRKKKLCDENDIPAEIWDAKQLAPGEPKLRPGLAGALRLREDGVLFPPCGGSLSHRTRQALRRGGSTGCPRSVPSPNGRRPARRWHKNSLQHRHQRRRQLLAAPGQRWGVIPVKKRKGHLAITDRYPGYVHHQIVELGYLKSAHSVSSDSVAFNIQPRKTGQILIGSSRQYDADSLAVDTHILARMIHRAQEYMPDVGTLSAIRVWTGHRPATPDKLPLIGPSIESPHIWLATGHEGLGITTSTGTGRLIADLILRRPTAIPAEPYSPSRYAHADSHAEHAHA